ncbi:MAG: hypothetical protein OEU90_06675 [Gammaproteobacteria bacterium]|jgi:hypothetical protein|nr:hypothetical protein [Gammaproteobacteria bacterium]MDH3758431.1 hypothetical protein [Gammaproteobacteria bacterium]MDH3805143.1 hypothetical protein [Gammaproteobacteria bacterium]MDH3834414.1 hypothetical protein [Nitrosopumilus sp.]
MNKQHKNKWMGIATPVSLVLALVLSSNVFAGPGKAVKNGPKGSITVFSICYLEENNKTDAAIRVETTITDTSSVLGDATLKSVTIQAQEKGKGPGRYNIGDPDTPDPVPVLQDGVANVSSTRPLCTAAADATPTLSAWARSVNAQVTVWITDDHNNQDEGFIARCSDDPETWDRDEVAELNVFKADLCQ